MMFSVNGGTVQDMEKLENLTTEASLATFKSDAMATGHWVLDDLGH